jgi:hypothetical protein
MSCRSDALWYSQFLASDSAVFDVGARQEALTLFGFRDRPHDFAATKVGATPEECVFLLDFARPLERIRYWLGFSNRWLGLTFVVLVPVVHQGQGKSNLVISVHRGQPYFECIPEIWRDHRGAARSTQSKPADGMQIVADYKKHFPDDWPVAMSSKLDRPT